MITREEKEIFSASFAKEIFFLAVYLTTEVIFKRRS